MSPQELEAMKARLKAMEEEVKAKEAQVRSSRHMLWRLQRRLFAATAADAQRCSRLRLCLLSNTLRIANRWQAGYAQLSLHISRGR